MVFLVALLVVVVVVIVLHLGVFLYLRRLASSKQSNICVKAPLLPVAMVTGEVAKYFNRRPESEVSSYEAYNTLWFKDFAIDRHHVWMRVATSSAIDDVISLSLAAMQKWSTQRGKIAIHASMRRIHFGITVKHALGEVSSKMEEAIYHALNEFDPGHLYRSISIRHPLRSAKILSKQYTQQAYLKLQSLLKEWMKSTEITLPSSSRSSFSCRSSCSSRASTTVRSKRSQVITSLLEYHLDREHDIKVAEEKAIADVIAYFLGAIANVSSVLGWMVYDFAHHPDMRRRVLNEVKYLFPQGVRQLVDRDRLRQAKTLHKCIHESIRLRDRFTTGIRRLTTDVTVPLPKKGSPTSSVASVDVSAAPESLSSSSSHDSAAASSTMTFPKGSYVILPYYYDGIDDATYDPDRQLPRSHFSMFGSGTHTCKGRDYAIAQITAIMGFLLLTGTSNPPPAPTGGDRTATATSRASLLMPPPSSSRSSIARLSASVSRLSSRLSSALLSLPLLSSLSSSSKSSLPFRWGAIGSWVSSVPWSMASTAGVHSPPDDAPLYVEM